MNCQRCLCEISNQTVLSIPCSILCRQCCEILTSDEKMLVTTRREAVRRNVSRYRLKKLQFRDGYYIYGEVHWLATTQPRTKSNADKIEFIRIGVEERTQYCKSMGFSKKSVGDYLDFKLCPVVKQGDLHTRFLIYKSLPVYLKSRNVLDVIIGFGMENGYIEGTFDKWHEYQTHLFQMLRLLGKGIMRYISSSDLNATLGVLFSRRSILAYRFDEYYLLSKGLKEDVWMISHPAAAQTMERFTTYNIDAETTMKILKTYFQQFQPIFCGMNDELLFDYNHGRIAIDPQEVMSRLQLRSRLKDVQKLNMYMNRVYKQVFYYGSTWKDATNVELARL
jgi:hypothetical protein